MLQDTATSDDREYRSDGRSSEPPHHDTVKSLEREPNVESAPISQSIPDLSAPAETAASKSASCSDLTAYHPDNVVSDNLPNVPSLFGPPSSQTVALESDIDFVRLGVVPESLVASLFDDDNPASGVLTTEQTATDQPKKGFVANDDPDATNWFYQDPQGVIQGI